MAAAPSPSPAPVRPLPHIRRDLRLSDGPIDADGRVALLIHDPVRDEHFRLGHPAAAAVRAWTAGDGERLRRDLAAEHGVEITAAQLGEIVEFLHASELTTSDRNGSWRGLADKQTSARPGIATRLMHDYLFFRIPLVDPDRFLTRIAPAFAAVGGRRVLLAVAAMLAVAAYPISREWDAFVRDLSGAISLEALPGMAVLLILLKAIHEFGHAIVAKRHGCRVPSMGVAIVLGVPMLYTDTTDAWRLADRRKRLAVTLAGVGAEALVAAAALLLWPFLPHGPAQQAACALAGTSLVTSLALNLNPCMRFDGYFALSDRLDVPNLQERAFALTREHMRHVLFGLERSPVTDLSGPKARLLVVYGWTTWVYRAVLYTGIAALVYAMSFKVLGLALFAFEVAFFLVRPAWREGRIWWAMRADLAARPRARAAAGLALAALLLSVLPWSRVIEAPAVRGARGEAALHATSPARVVEVLVSDGAEVETGRLLVRLEAPALAAQRRRVQAEITALEARLTGAPASEAERAAVPVLSSQLAAAREKLAGLDRLQRDLELRAPIDGTVVDLDPDLRPGVWVDRGREIGRLIAPDGTGVRALVEEADVRRLRAGADAVFVPDAGIGPSTRLRLVAVAETNERRISEPVLADVHGGPIATGEGRDGPTPVASLFAVTLESDTPAPLFFERGRVRIAAEGESPMGAVARRVARVLTRESGF